MKRLTEPTHRVLAAGAAGAGVIIATALAVDRLWAPVGTGALPPLIPVESPAVGFSVSRARALDGIFAAIGYAPLKATQAATVPPLLLRRLPDGFGEDGDEARRKHRFVAALLPIVLRVNRTIARQRATVDRLARRTRAGRPLSAREWRWLGTLANLYRTQPDGWQTLRRRVAPIPPSLAIAQAAVESGWGSSRFAREGNALFGQWTYGAENGLKPRERDKGRTHRIKSYDRLIDSVWDYARNLNTNRAYRDLRRLRAAGGTGGAQLAAGLASYSEKGAAYVALIRRIIAENDLARLDGLSLDDRPPSGY